MQKIIIILATLCFAINTVIAQISAEEQTLLDDLTTAKQSSRVDELSYQKGLLDALSPLFMYYWQTGNYTKGATICLEYLDVIEKLLGRYDDSYAEFQSYLGQAYTGMGRYEDAKNTLLSMYDTYQHVTKIEYPHRYASSLASLGDVFLMFGDYVQAEKYYFESLAVINKYHVDEIRKSGPLGGLSSIYISTGEYKKAEQYMLESLRLLPKENETYGQNLNNMGILYYRMGLYDKALDYFIQSYEDKKRKLPANHHLLGSSLSNIGFAYTYLGDHKAAEKYMLEAQELQKESLQNNPRAYATNQINLGHLYSLMGDMERAIHYQNQGAELLGQIIGKDHLDYASVLFTRALIEIDAGKYDSAIQSATEALSIQTKLDEKHPESVITRMILGKVYLMKSDYTNAESMLKNALAYAKILLGEHHDNYAETLYLLGVLYDKKKDAIQAENYLQQSSLAFENLYSNQHPKYITAQNALGEVYQKTGQYAKARACFQQAAQSTKEQFVGTTDYMSERQRSLFWETIRHRYQSIYPAFAYESVATDSTVAEFAYNNELFLKGLLLHSSATIHNSIMNSGDHDLIQQWKSLKEMNMQILALQENDPNSAYIETLKKEAEDIEKQLTATSTIFRESKSSWDISWESVRASLQPKQVAIEFFVATNSQAENVYCALLVSTNSKHPLLIPLCKENELATLIALTPSQIYDYSQKGAELYQLIWSPILVHIQEGSTINFSPAGHLHQLAIEYLPCDIQHTMQDLYHMERLSSTRELVKNTTAAPLTRAVLYGGLQYDMDGEELLSESERYQGQAFVSRAIDGSIDRAGVQYLPGTKKEVDYIHQLLTTNQIQSSLYVGGSGNEESLKALDGRDNQILHIATHGFFWENAVAQSSDYYLQRMLNTEQKSLPLDPLSRCGLLFAGANLSLSGHADEIPQGVQDGILTAKEISLLDLSHTQIAILSACETGRGEVTAEGVFGLQRALKQAGVQTIIMSLWSVDDAATQMLMQHFYTNWIKDKMHKREAFQKAQDSVKMQYTAPEYWAGFILLD